MKRKITTSLVLITLFLIIMSANVLAKSDTFSLSTENTSVMEGDTVVVTLSNTGTVAGVEGVLEYNPDALIYKSVTFDDTIAEKNTDYGNVRAHDSGQIRFSILGDTTNGTTGKWAIFTFKVKTGFAGSTQVSLSNMKVSDVAAKLSLVEIGDTVNLTVNGTKIKDASITLGESITVNYYAVLSESNKDAKMTFTMNGNSVSVDGVLVSGNEYKFAFEGISPQCMTDAITAQLVDGEEVLDSYGSFTVRSYCDELMTMDASILGVSSEKYDAMKTLIADMLEYGAQSQNYRNYKLESLANKDITGQSEFVALTDEWKAAPSNAGENINITAGGVWFANVNKIYLKFTTTDIVNTTLEFNGKTYTSDDFELVSGNTYIFYSDAMPPSEFGQGKFAQFKYNGTSEASITYCVNSYIYAKQNQETKMGNLARALYNYGVSAVEYMKLQ